MSHRTWIDRAGRSWQVRPRSRGSWVFEPLPGNPEKPRTARAPSWQDDPFELSKEELQRVFDAAPDPDRPRPMSPFLDD